jgi:hypothetical protein
MAKASLFRLCEVPRMARPGSPPRTAKAVADAASAEMRHRAAGCLHDIAEL